MLPEGMANVLAVALDYACDDYASTLCLGILDNNISSLMLYHIVAGTTCYHRSTLLSWVNPAFESRNHPSRD